MKCTPFKKKIGKPLKRTPFKKKPRKPKTKRMKKLSLLKELRETYDLPVITCSRYGTSKSATRTDLLKGMLWAVFAKCIRKRDKGQCISCGLPKTYEELQAGHFAPAGGNDLELLFMEENVNGECEGCNGFDLFHLVPMRSNLIKKWGIEKVQEIEEKRQRKGVVKWTELDYVQRINHYYEQLKSYE